MIVLCMHEDWSVIFLENKQTLNMLLVMIVWVEIPFQTRTS